MGAPANGALFTADAIKAQLRTGRIGRQLMLLPSVGSTNQEAMALAQQGAEDGTVVVAERQTAGRGRLGRQWHSPAGDNLYCSVILRHLPDKEKLPLIPLASALAVARAIQRVTGLPAKLKWPNDVLAGGRKLGGLLCEGAGIGHADPVVVVGIGLNVNGSRDGFPEELRGIATSLAVELGHRVDRAAMLAAMLGELEQALGSLAGAGADEVVQSYIEHCATLGQRVKVSLSDRDSLEGWAESIAPDGSLLLRLEEPGGRRVEVRAGDVLHLR